MGKIHYIFMEVFTFQLNKVKREKGQHTVFVSLTVENDVTLYFCLLSAIVITWLTCKVRPDVFLLQEMSTECSL